MSHTFRLCYITDRHALEPRPLLPVIFEALRAGVDLVQVREKDLETRSLVELVKAVVEKARGPGTPVVINDRLDVALALGAAGVHLGTRSMPAPWVRQYVPKSFLVGVSCHSPAEVSAAESAGADYVLLGPIFPTVSKLTYGPPLGLEVLGEVAARVKIPLLALGGITVERVKPCLAAGATGIAGIAVFQNCESVEARVRELLAQFTL